MAFGPWVRVARESAGISLKDFAQSIGISQAYWSRIERGLELAPKDSLIIAACDRLGLSTDRAFIAAQRLPPDMQLRLVEPLRLLFKDEVRAVGAELGLPQELIWRQPFPGPGLAVRCLGEVTPQRVEILRAADQIFTEELRLADLLQTHEDEASKLSGTSQAFAVLLPVHSVGVMGDQRTYAETLALRAVTTTDFMTADWARLPQELLARVSNRIVNEVPGINRVVYDITSKPPATIEWE